MSFQDIPDPEVEAIAEIYERLQVLEYAEQRRVINWLSGRIESDESHRSVVGPA